MKELAVLKTDDRNGKAPELPVWNLEARGNFHRKDIYDDVR